MLVCHIQSIEEDMIVLARWKRKFPLPFIFIVAHVSVLSVAHCFHKLPEAIEGRSLAPDVLCGSNGIAPVEKCWSDILLPAAVDTRLELHVGIPIRIHVNHCGWTSPA